MKRSYYKNSFKYKMRMQAYVSAYMESLEHVISKKLCNLFFEKLIADPNDSNVLTALRLILAKAEENCEVELLISERIVRIVMLREVNEAMFLLLSEYIANTDGRYNRGWIRSSVDIVGGCFFNFLLVERFFSNNMVYFDFNFLRREHLDYAAQLCVRITQSDDTIPEIMCNFLRSSIDNSFVINYIGSNSLYNGLDLKMLAFMKTLKAPARNISFLVCFPFVQDGVCSKCKMPQDSRISAYLNGKHGSAGLIETFLNDNIDSLSGSLVCHICKHYPGYLNECIFKRILERIICKDELELCKISEFVTIDNRVVNSMVGDFIDYVTSNFDLNLFVKCCNILAYFDLKREHLKKFLMLVYVHYTEFTDYVSHILRYFFSIKRSYMRSNMRLVISYYYRIKYEERVDIVSKYTNVDEDIEEFCSLVSYGLKEFRSEFEDLFVLERFEFSQLCKDLPEAYKVYENYFRLCTERTMSQDNVNDSYDVVPLVLLYDHKLLALIPKKSLVSNLRGVLDLFILYCKFRGNRSSNCFLRALNALIMHIETDLDSIFGIIFPYIEYGLVLCCERCIDVCKIEMVEYLLAQPCIVASSEYSDLLFPHKSLSNNVVDCESLLDTITKLSHAKSRLGQIKASEVIYKILHQYVNSNPRRTCSYTDPSIELVDDEYLQKLRLFLQNITNFKVPFKMYDYVVNIFGHKRLDNIFNQVKSGLPWQFEFGILNVKEFMMQMNGLNEIYLAGEDEIENLQNYDGKLLHNEIENWLNKNTKHHEKLPSNITLCNLYSYKMGYACFLKNFIAFTLKEATSEWAFLRDYYFTERIEILEFSAFFATRLLFSECFDTYIRLIMHIQDIIDSKPYDRYLGTFLLKFHSLFFDDILAVEPFYIASCRSNTVFEKIFYGEIMYNRTNDLQFLNDIQCEYFAAADYDSTLCVNNLQIVLNRQNLYYDSILQNESHLATSLCVQTGKIDGFVENSSTNSTNIGMYFRNSDKRYTSALYGYDLKRQGLIDCEDYILQKLRLSDVKVETLNFYIDILCIEYEKRCLIDTESNRLILAKNKKFLNKLKYMRIKVLRKQGEYDKCKKLSHQSILDHDPLVLYQLAKVYLMEGNLYRSKQYLSRFVHGLDRSTVEYVKSQLLLAKICQSISFLERCKALCKNDLALLSKYYLLMAQLREKEGDFGCALSCYCDSLLASSYRISAVFPKIIHIFTECIPKDSKILYDLVPLIGRLIEDLEPFELEPFFPQIVPKIVNTPAIVYETIKKMIVKILASYDRFWFLVVYYFDKLPIRNRIDEIVSELASSNKSLFNCYIDFCLFLGVIAAFPVEGESSVTIHQIINSSKCTTIYRSAVEYETMLGKMRCCLVPNLKMDITIAGIKEDIVVYKSLQSPKRIELIGSDGRAYRFLCKRNDDLRRDARFMDISKLLNGLFNVDYECESRGLNIICYQVIPITAKYGLIEWVDGLKTLKSICSEMYSSIGIDVGLLLSEYFVRRKIQDVEKFESLQAEIPTVLDIWFKKYFTDRKNWFLARLNYARSLAVMSVVGWMMGLGDRHLENIMLDLQGNIVHVDLNSIFNESLRLAVPERVPFRLTKNLVSALGPLGTNGVFRETMRIVFRVIIRNHHLIENNLLSFVYDSSIVGLNKNRCSTIILSLRARLDAAKSEDIVDKLIEEAISSKNLANMYVGWMPIV